MPRPSGAISFGLVTIPIKVLPATEDRSVRFRHVHLEDMSPIRNRKVCEVDGKELRQEPPLCRTPKATNSTSSEGRCDGAGHSHSFTAATSTLAS